MKNTKFTRTKISWSPSPETIEITEPWTFSTSLRTEDILDNIITKTNQREYTIKSQNYSPFYMNNYVDIDRETILDYLCILRYMPMKKKIMSQIIGHSYCWENI